MALAVGSRLAKRPKPDDEPVAAAAAAADAPTFGSLPDALHYAIATHLSRPRRLAVSETSKALLRPYGGQFRALSIRNGGVRQDAALRRLLIRQEALERLNVDDYDPAVLQAPIDAIAQGAGQHLTTFSLRHMSKPPDDETAAALAALFGAEPDPLPALETLSVASTCRNSNGGLEGFLEALGHGNAPRLRELRLRVERDGLGAGVVTDLLASALEARRAKGCVGLASLDLGQLNWVMGVQLNAAEAVIASVAPDAHRRLVAALLPTVRTLPFEEEARLPDRAADVSALVCAQGAPCVREFCVSAETVRCVPRLSGLKTLTLSDDCGPALARVLEEAFGPTGGGPGGGGPPRPCLPSVRELKFSVEDVAGYRELLRVLGRVGAFPGVKEMRFGFSYGFRGPVGGAVESLLEALGDALAAGACASLERLYLNLRSVPNCDLGEMIPGLAAAPCARTLRALTLWRFIPTNTGGLDALAAALAEGRFPALVELDLAEAPLRSSDVSRFLSHFSAEAPLSLEVLCLSDAHLGDSGVAAVTAALKEGHLGTRLRKLRLWGHLYRAGGNGFSDVGLSALRRGITWNSEYVKRLKVLSVNTKNVSFCHVEELVYDVVKACPALKKLEVSGQSLSKAQIKGLRSTAASAGVRGCRVLDFEDVGDDDEDADSAAESETHG